MSRRLSPQRCPTSPQAGSFQKSHSLWTLRAPLPLDSQYGRCPLSWENPLESEA